MDEFKKGVGRPKTRLRMLADELIGAGYSQWFTREFLFLHESKTQLLLPLDTLKNPSAYNMNLSPLDLERLYEKRRDELKKEIKKITWDSAQALKPESK